MPATDNYQVLSTGWDSPYAYAAAITPHDTNELGNVTRAIYVGGAGNVTYVPVGGSANVTLVAVPVGTELRVQATAVRATGTGATNLVAWW